MNKQQAEKIDGRPPQGGLSGALRAVFFKRLTVSRSEKLGGRFYRITLESPKLKAVKWGCGMKMQIAMESVFIARTYTPADWNAEAGVARIIGYAHGEGPGSAWLRGVKQGDRCDLFGPGATLDASRIAGAVAIVGDETSIGLMHSLTFENRARKVQAILEVDDARHPCDCGHAWP